MEKNRVSVCCSGADASAITTVGSTTSKPQPRRQEVLRASRFLQKWVLLMLCIIPLFFANHVCGSEMHAFGCMGESKNAPLRWYAPDVGSSPVASPCRDATLGMSVPLADSVTFSGWVPSAVRLENTGIFPAAVTMGRYLLIIGGSRLMPPLISGEDFIEKCALTTIAALDFRMGILVTPMMLVHNGSHLSQKNKPRNHDDPPLPPRVPAKLPLPAVGTANTVRLGSAAYVVGFCTIVPEGVVLSSSDTLNTFLRSLQVIRLYQEEFSPEDDVTLYIENTSFPATTMPRYNASCVGNGNDTIYIVGGVSLEKGLPLASVSQYNVVTGQFIDAGWTLDSPLINPGVLGNDELVFLAAGSLPNNDQRFLDGIVSVVDLVSVKADIGFYEDQPLGWLSPQLMMYNHTLVVMGATGDRSFDRQQVWPDITQGLRSAQEVPIGFSPLRTHAVVVGVPNADSLTVYLAGGWIPSPDGKSISSDVFTGTMSVKDDHVSISIEGFHYISVADKMSHFDDKEPKFTSHVMSNLKLTTKASEELEGVHTIATSASILSSSSSMNTGMESQESAQSVTVSISPTITPTDDIPTSTPTPVPPPSEPPNNDGNVTVLVNGYEPLWYNFTFSILLSENTAQACPGIRDHNWSVTGKESVTVSPCLLRISDSPTCNAALLDMGYLTSENTEPFSVKTTDPDTMVVSEKRFIAVGPLTLTGSLADGILNLTGKNSLYSEEINGVLKFHRRRRQPTFGKNTTSTFYEQLFTYVCFSSGLSSLPQCNPNNSRPRFKGWKAAKNSCTTAFYKPLNGDRPFVLSPVTNWVPETTTTTDIPSQIPSEGISRMTILLFVTSAAVAAISGSFLCFLAARSSRLTWSLSSEQQSLLSVNRNDGDEEDFGCAVGRGAPLSANQKKSLLDGKYRVLRRLGRGSFSVVYLVERVEDGECFALKYVQCTDNVDRIEAMRECEVAYALQGHPNVIRLVDMFMSYRFDANLHANGGGHHRRGDHGWRSPDASVIVRVDDDTEVNGAVPPKSSAGHITTAPGERYLSLVMAYHEKGDLGRWIRQQKSEPMISEVTIVSIAFQILTVLQFMHRQNPPIIHRDLKPENILLDSVPPPKHQGGAWWGGPSTTNATGVSSSNSRGGEPIRIVVTDFGLSRMMDKTFCETGVGSLPYVAPECWQRHYSTKVDIWAVGCILYAACAKRVESDNVKVMFSESSRPDFKKKLLNELTQVYGYSMALAAFIMYLLEPDPVRRPSAEDALRLICKRRRDVVGTVDDLTMVPIYKNGEEEEEGEGEKREENALDATGHCPSQSIEEKEKRGRAGVASGENRQQCISWSSNGITVGGVGTAAVAPGAEALVTRENTMHYSQSASGDVSVQPTPSRGVLPAGSLGPFSPAESCRSQPTHSCGTSDGVFRDEKFHGASTPSKRQLELFRLKKYFETIADENEQCDFFIVQQPPSFPSVPLQTVFRSSNTLTTSADASTTLGALRECATGGAPLSWKEKE